MGAKLGWIHSRPRENQPKTGFLQLVHWWVLGQTGPQGPDTNKGEELVTTSTHVSKKAPSIGWERKRMHLPVHSSSSSSFLQQIFWFSHRGDQ